MKKTFATHPQVVFMDSTYRINLENFALLAAVVMDSDGFGQPIFLVFLHHEKEIILRNVLKTFKKENQVNSSKNM
jgi:hypothetical protein